MSAARALALVALAGTLAAPSAAAQAGGEGRPPFELSRPQPGDGPLSVSLRLQGALPAYAPGASPHDWIVQMLAQEAGTLGQRDEALRWGDAGLAAQRWDSVGTIPPGVRGVDAVGEIVRRASEAQVVMVNEAHHDAATRLLTLALLRPLYEQGYRYLAAETFAPDSVLARSPDYPTADMGVYLDEPVFGALVREALGLGYTLIPYEQEEAQRIEGDTLSGQERRDLSQAQNLTARTFARDPGARVLVHAGYSHVNEQAGEYFHPMARYFREATGIDPLTVDQTEVGPRSDEAYEHPAYRAAVDRGLVSRVPVILLDGAGEPTSPVGTEVSTDLQVLRPRLSNAGLAAALGYGRLPALTLPGGCGRCVVEVRRGDEGPDAVPVDRTVAPAGGTVSLHGPRDVPLVVTVVEGTTGREVDRRITSARSLPF